MAGSLIHRGLLVRIEAKSGHEENVENFLRQALQLVDEEQQTIAWFALRIGPSSFGIFDAFPDDAGRDAHLQGQVAAQLMEKAPEWLEGEPTIEKVDILAAKLPLIVPADATQSR